MLRFWTFKRLIIAFVYAAFCMPIMLVHADMPPIMIDGYHVTINAETYLSGKVTITETFTLEKGWLENWRLDHPGMNLDGRLVITRTVDVTSRSGVYEITFNPLDSDNIDDVVVTVTQGVTRPVTLEGPMCDYDCDLKDVQVNNLPADTNLQRKSATGVETSTYNGKDSITWSLMSLREGIGFNFIPPAAVGLKSVFQVLWDKGLIGQISVIVGAIITFLAAVIVTLFRGRIARWLEKRLFGKDQPKQA
jgi:hypothetical protein